METKLKIPAIANFGVISSDKLQAALTIHQPQIVQHLAFLPIESQRVNEKLLDTIGLIEEFTLEQDIIVKEHETNQRYDTAVYENRTNKNVIIPASTHLKGGMQNRANNQTEILGLNDKETYNVNCFEPSRGSGDNRFHEFEDTPADVARETMIRTSGFDGSWGIIEDYTDLVHAGRGALTTFNEKTEEDRAKYALNFETVPGQTGATIITKGLSMIEVFPTPNTFNIYRERLLRGKVASLFYKIHKSQPSQLILPSEVESKVNEMLDIVKKAINQTIEKGIKKHGLIVGRGRSDGRAIDIILTDTEEPQIAYIFGAW